MKKHYALILFLAGMLVSCSSDAMEGNPFAPPLTGMISITGTAKVGETLIANTEYLGGSGNISFQWKRNGINTSYKGNYYTVQPYDVNANITVTVTRSGNSGNITSAVSIFPAFLGAVHITGTVEVGETLLADISGLNSNGVIFYQWKREGTNIGTNNEAYAIQPSDAGYSITVTITSTENSGSIESEPTVYVPYVLSGTVSINGTAEVGGNLHINDYPINCYGEALYQWKRGGSDIGANSSHYTLQADDAGSTITLTVTCSESTGSITSNPTAVVSYELFGTVKIDGKAEVGQELTANTDNLGNCSGDIFYQWKRGNAGIGTNSSTYAVQYGDAGSAIAVTVVCSENTGSISSQTENVVFPVLTGKVIITGTAEVGQTLIANTNSLDGSGTISYQWKRGEIDIAYARSGTYTVQSYDVGYAISVTVSRSENAASVSSAKTFAVVYPAVFSGTVSIAYSMPIEVGQMLAADTHNHNCDGGFISYQWKRGGVAIGANSNTYVLQAADLGSTFTVTATCSEIPGSIESSPTSPVVLPLLSGTVSIAYSMPIEVGQMLAVNITGLGGSGDISYQWKRGSANIGTNASTYTVQAADIGSTISVTVTRSKNSGYINSEQTPTVIYPLLTGTVSIVGVPEAGEELTVDITGLGGSGDISYQWMFEDLVIISNSNSYTVKEADAGKTITVIVTRSGYSGSITDNAGVL
ncbi:MAG: hypothetical protein FWB90_02635 [Fibromonadales bacterium]|nr:hypothetical protein [Fibromonadales bacterium]